MLLKVPLLIGLFGWDAEKTTLNEFCSLAAFLLLTSQCTLLLLSQQ